MQDGNSRVQKRAKSNKLKFKSQKSFKRTPQGPKAKSPVGSSDIEEQEPQPPKQAKSSSNASSTASDLIEWGPFINGYRFIASKDSETPLHYHQKHTLLTKDPNHPNESYNWSYMDLPEYKSARDTLEEKYSNREEFPDATEFSYEEYFNEWEYIKEHGLRDIVFPLVNQNSGLEKNEVFRFLQTGADSEYGNILKIERIRWHPDKMIRILKLDVNDMVYKELSEKITKTFQIVNQLWEEYNSSNNNNNKKV